MTFLDLTGLGQLRQRASARLERVDVRPRERLWTRLGFGLAILCLLAVSTMAFARWQIEGDVVPWDSKNHFYPMFRFLGDALRHGTLPLWNPYHFGGYPAVADPQSLIFTPSMVLFALIAPQASMEVFDAVILFHLFLGGVGMLGLARRWRWHPMAGLLAALVFMLGGAASSRLQHTGMIISYAWFPLAVWSLQAALDGRSLRLAALCGVFVTLMALGRDQVAYLLCIALTGFALSEIVRAETSLAYLRSRAPVLAGAALLTFCLMITPILLTLQFVHDSNRPGIAYGMALAGSLDPVNLVTLLVPNMFGSLDQIYDYWGPGAASIAGNDWTDRTIDYLFVGTVPIVLLLWHGIAGGRLVQRGARYSLGLLVVAVLYALGRHTPFFGLVFDWVPGVSLYRRPADATFPLNIALAFACGGLLHRFIEDGLPRLRIGYCLPALGSLAGTAVLVGAGLAFAQQGPHIDAALQTLLGSSAITALVALILWTGRKPRFREPAALVLVVGTAGQLVWHNSGSPLNAEPARNYSAFYKFWPDEAKGMAVLEAELAARQAKGDHPRVEILGLDGPWQNAAMVFKMEDTLGYNPLRIAPYEHAVGVAESSNDPNLRAFPDTFRGYNSRLATLLGLDYLVLDRKIDDLPRHIPRAHATALFMGDRFYVYRLDGPSAPRVYVATHVRPVDSDDIIDGGVMPDFDIAHDALIDSDDVALLGTDAITRVATQSPTPAPAPAPAASITAYSDNAVRIDVDTPADGLVVLHDLYYPGWTVRVDGHPASVLRANLIFRGVDVPPGHHVVEFSFHPLSLANLVTAADSLLQRDDE